MVRLAKEVSLAIRQKNLAKNLSLIKINGCHWFIFPLKYRIIAVSK